MKIGNKYLLFAACAVIVVIIDQLTKALALKHLADGREIPLLGDLLKLRLVHNSGAAFSLLAGHTWIFTLVGVLFVVLMPWLVRYVYTRVLDIIVGVLWGGAIGNLIDRFVQPPAIGSGHVVDFIDYGGFFVGNVADIAIVAAAIVAVILAGRDQQQGESRTDPDTVSQTGESKTDSTTSGGQLA